MTTDSKWLIYGATGYTGKLIAQEAVKQGQRPVLAGRSARKLQPIAEELGLKWVAVELTDKTALEAALAGVELVLNAAGPFGPISQPLVQACIDKGVNYLDIANELSSYQLMLSFDREAQERGIALISGVGFGTTATNFLAKQAVQLLPDANQMEVGIAPYNYTTEPATGVEKTALEVIAGGGKVYKEGKLVSIPLGHDRKFLTLPDGTTRSMLSSPLGDLIAAQLLTGVPNVTSYLELSLSDTSRRLMPLIQTLLKIRWLRRFLQKQIDQKAAKSVGVVKPFEQKQSYAWVKVSNSQGKELELWLETGEGYEYTARSSLKAVERVFEMRPKGALTPAQAFEPDFAEKIEGVSKTVSPVR